MDVARWKWFGVTGGAARGLGLLLSVAMVGCADLESPLELGPESIWEASLFAVASSPAPDAPTVTGQAGAVVQGGRTEVGILLEGLDSTVHWGVFRGSCSQAGELVGSTDSYPLLSPGSPSAETLLGSALSATESYHVRAGPNADGSAPISCGELVRRSEV